MSPRNNGTFIPQKKNPAIAQIVAVGDGAVVVGWDLDTGALTSIFHVHGDVTEQQRLEMLASNLFVTEGAARLAKDKLQII